MAWIISIMMLVYGCIKGNDILVITSGLYAIAGCIGGAASILKNTLRECFNYSSMAPDIIEKTEEQ